MKFNIERLRNIKERLAENKIDAILLTALENIRYLTSFSGSSAFLLITKERGHFITDFRYKTVAEDEIKGYKIVIYKNSIIDEIERLANKEKISHIGIESRNITLEQYQKLTKRLKKIKIIPTFNVVEGLRVIKSPIEIENIGIAIKRAEKAYKKINSNIKIGTSEKEIALRLEYAIKSGGSDRLPFETIVASGYRAALPHAVSGKRLLKVNDSVIIDFGAEYKGYYADITRTRFIGRRINRRQREIYQTLLDAQAEAINLIKPDAKARDIDAAARRVIANAGYGRYFGHGTGHGVGLMVHELPSISPKSEDILREGMIFTVEPGIYIPGWGGVRIEDMVLVTKTGCRILTTLSKET
ncbi:MAG: aminopeptidase P family protein [Nitrospirae bacterium]|nr:aminopeptidase P family protein [Nitrospirota bacterium]